MSDGLYRGESTFQLSEVNRHQKGKEDWRDHVQVMGGIVCCPNRGLEADTFVAIEQLGEGDILVEVRTFHRDCGIRHGLGRLENSS